METPTLAAIIASVFCAACGEQAAQKPAEQNRFRFRSCGFQAPSGAQAAAKTPLPSYLLSTR